ncbi:MAG: peptidoglycan DD-metalloendopeptidase family protein [Gemmatimonadaceae bacterium]|jgi:septal ring factor EnvC (AmiA/AmiB activator)|nr:peptidoglycan DD-metalloendopeptidase family protein [Gemmatimonadaceae bacterium]
MAPGRARPRARRLAALVGMCLALVGVCLALVATTPAVLAAQQPPPTGGSSEDRIRREREELEQLRRERQLLEQRMRELQGNVHDLTEEVRNLDAQADATARAVAALDRQLAALAESVDEVTGAMLRAEDELVAKRAVLRRRLQDIYKRGALRDAEALLAAESFGQLVSRYKYLHLIAVRDRALVGRVGELRDQIGRQREQLVLLQGDMERSRRDRADEEQRLRSLERDRTQSLATVQRQARQVQARLERYRRDEVRLAGAIERLEADRRRAELRPNAPAPSASTLRTSDFGRLDWPVDGALLYTFGRNITPENTTTRWNGVGIQAPLGTPVKSVAAGEVMIAEAIGTYGLTVVVQHGGGDYSVYGSLQRLQVKKGERVAKGDVVGTVGAADPEMPAHLHFEIRPRGRAMDPLQWLRSRR